MKLEIERYRILIIPDKYDERDNVYIERVLGLLKDGDEIRCRRVNAHALSRTAYLEIKR